MTTIERIHPGPRASQLITAAGRFETSGLVAQAPGDISAQTRCVLGQLDAMNQVYDAWAAAAPPTCACVGAQLASPQYLIEIQASGYL